jgi:hypothetical protein
VDHTLLIACFQVFESLSGLRCSVLVVTLLIWSLLLAAKPLKLSATQVSSLSCYLKFQRIVALRVQQLCFLGEQYCHVDLISSISEAFAVFVMNPCDKFASSHCTGFQKELYNSIPNATVWWVLWRRLHLNAYKLQLKIKSAAFKHKRFHNTRHTVTLEYHCKDLLDTPRITSGSHIEPLLSQVKLGAFCYIMTVQNTVHVLWINVYKLSKPRSCGPTGWGLDGGKELHCERIVLLHT